MSCNISNKIFYKPFVEIINIIANVSNGIRKIQLQKDNSKSSVLDNF